MRQLASDERLLGDLDCLKCKVLEEADSLGLTRGYEEKKHSVLAPVDVLKLTRKLKELLARGKERSRGERMGKKDSRWEKKKKASSM